MATTQAITEAPLLIRSLSRPSTFCHLCDQVKLIETHISWVVLTGTYAYKIKKPVKYDFVDFSTLEKRRAACEEELRLNKRLASDIYIEVVPISGTLDKPVVGFPISGRVLEYAVKMHEFSQDQLLSDVISRGELRDRHIDRFAEELGSFHGQLASAFATGLSSEDYCREISKQLAGNFDTLCQVHFDNPHECQLQSLASWCRREYDRLRPILIQRFEDGFVRECHGDLHAGNMILVGGQVRVFDAIEFNPTLRWIDVISEVAFLFMDLSSRGHANLAHRFLSRYLEYTGDYGGLEVLRFFAVYRALVRAKVDELRVEQFVGSSDERDRLRQEIVHYLELASSFTLSQPRLLAITHGVSGSGKSRVAERLVEDYGAIRLRSDVERKRLFGRKPLEVTPVDELPDVYSSETSHETYARLLQLANLVVRAGFPVVVDATFLKASQRQAFSRLAEEQQALFRILDLQVGQETLQARIASRLASCSDASEADLDVLRIQLSADEPLSGNEQVSSVKISEEWNGTSRIELGIH